MTPFTRLLISLWLAGIGIAAAESDTLGPMGAEQSYNFRRVGDHITTSGVVGAENLRAMGKQGYDVVINLLPDDSQYAVADEADILAAQGIRYVYIPVDFSRPDVSDYEAFARAMKESEGKQVHVHCAANFRVSAFYSLYAVREGHWSQDDADALLDSLWSPDENPGWPEFIEAVRRLD